MLNQLRQSSPVKTPARAFLGLLISTAALQSAELSFTNSTPMVLPILGNATPYSTSVQVAGAAGLVTHVTIGLRLTHTAPNDIDALLVSPSGKKVLFMSDVGIGRDFINCFFTFDDLAAAALEDTAADVTNVVQTVKPTNNARACSTCSEVDLMPAPAPEPPYASKLAEFNGESPNGAWTLYVLDDENFDQGRIDSWTLKITSEVEPPDSPRLQLALGDPGKIILSWPGTATGFILQSRVVLSESSPWADVAGTPALVDDKFVIELDGPPNTGYYRLHLP